MENLKEINKILQEKNQDLKKEIENIKSKTSIDDNSKTIKKYEIRIMDLEKELKYYKEKEEQTRINTKNYFQLKTKNKHRHCDYCNVDIKESSWSNHKISKYHIENTKEQD